MIELRILKVKDKKKISNLFENGPTSFRVHFDG